MTDAKSYRHRFPMTIIQHAIWLYHRFPLSYRDVQELLHQRGIQVSIVVNGRPSWAGRTRFSTPARMRTPLLHETLREWCTKFATLFRASPPGTPTGFPVASGQGVYERRWCPTLARLGQSSAVDHA